MGYSIGDESVVWAVGGEMITNPPSPTIVTGLSSSPFGMRGAPPYGSPLVPLTQVKSPLLDPEEKALPLAIAEMYESFIDLGLGMGGS